MVGKRNSVFFLHNLTTDLSQWFLAPSTHEDLWLAFPCGPHNLKSLVCPHCIYLAMVCEAIALVKAEFWKDIWQSLQSAAFIAISGSEKNLKAQSWDSGLLYSLSCKKALLLSIFCEPGAVGIILSNFHTHPSFWSPLYTQRPEVWGWEWEWW